MVTSHTASKSHHSHVAVIASLFLALGALLPSAARADSYILSDTWADDIEVDETYIDGLFWGTGITENEYVEEQAGIGTSVYDPAFQLLNYGGYFSGDNYARVDLDVWQNPDWFMEGENTVESLHWVNGVAAGFTWVSIGSYRVANRYQWYHEENGAWVYIKAFCDSKCQKYWKIVNPFPGGPTQYITATGIAYQFFFLTKCQISFRAHFLPSFPPCYPT